MNVTITNKDVANLKKFMISHSKKAKRQKVLSFYAIPFEFILVGLILDGFLKTVPLISITSAVLATLWLVFYPMYYKKICQRELLKAQNAPESSIEMKFNITDDKKITFSNSATPKPSEIFELESVERIVQSQDNYFVGFKEGHHIVLPINSQTTDMMLKIKNNFESGDIEKLTL